MAGGRVWLSGRAYPGVQPIVRVDLATNRKADTVPTEADGALAEIPVGVVAKHLTAAEGSLWVGSDSGRVTRQPTRSPAPSRSVAAPPRWLWGSGRCGSSTPPTRPCCASSQPPSIAGRPHGSSPYTKVNPTSAGAAAPRYSRILRP